MGTTRSMFPDPERVQLSGDLLNVQMKEVFFYLSDVQTTNTAVGTRKLTLSPKLRCLVTDTKEKRKHPCESRKGVTSKGDGAQ
jgi:hypothetical protein